VDFTWQIPIAAEGKTSPADGCSFHGFIVQRDILADGESPTAEQLHGRRVELDITLPHAYWPARALAPLGLEIDGLEVVDVPTRQRQKVIKSE